MKTDHTPSTIDDIYYLQYVTKDHQLNQPLPEDITDEMLITFYKNMLLINLFDTRVINLQRTGQLGTYPASHGQEAVMTGVGYALYPDDVYAPYYRDHGVAIARQCKLEKIISQWGGDERGFKDTNLDEDFPVNVPIGTQCSHAAGIAFSFKYKKSARAAITMIGDGGTSEGEFHEALNIAGAWHLPMVTIINNNQWAISVPLSKQTSTKTLAQKAIAAGIPSIQVDGNDVIAVYQATRNAIDRARRGDGPTVIETISYRLCDHTTADDAKRYQPDHEVNEAKKLEPIARLGYFLKEKKLWSREQDNQLREQLKVDIEKAVDLFLKQAPAEATDIIDFLYETLPVALEEQREDIRTQQ